MDWGAWSREAVAMMRHRTQELLRRYQLEPGAAYAWDLETADMHIGGRRLALTVVGTVSGDSFLWAWANEALPVRSHRLLEDVRSFGEYQGLGLLTAACHPGGLAQLQECVAIAGRVLDASGVWLDRTESGQIGFLLHADAPS